MSEMHRRTFLGTAAASIAAPLALAAGKGVAANEKVTVGLIGCGGMGRADLHAFRRLPDFEIAAVCDVDPTHTTDALNDIKKAGRSTAKVRVEKDFRRVLEH